MKQVWITATGDPENLQLRETPDLEPQAGELRIRARASGVNFLSVSGGSKAPAYRYASTCTGAVFWAFDEFSYLPKYPWQ